MFCSALKLPTWSSLLPVQTAVEASRLPLSIASDHSDWKLQQALHDTCFQTLELMFTRAHAGSAGSPLRPRVLVAEPFADSDTAGSPALDGNDGEALPHPANEAGLPVRPNLEHGDPQVSCLNVRLLAVPILCMVHAHQQLHI